ncbi:MAG: tRNA (N6-isopentenyl adenosine(37)-C2)-methylthiotransferase MiaB [Collinsella sp. 60_9]|nr:MAG: tRNA (N6-isopentenyl adenosine(37)-C2)-methylthiotransferase MiaB [Collinsella sp. 60_9]
MHMDQRSVRTYFIRTFGCQMNQHDSERVSGLLDSYGCLMALDPEHADIVVFMTCCVREAADTRLYGQCNSCKSLPPSPSGKRVVAVGGCIAQRDGEGLLTNVDNVNVIFGTHSIAHVAELIAEAFLDGKRHIRTNEHEDTDAMSMPWHRETQYHAWVPIMTGCNNFCTYCIVPYVRGREKSRPFEEIVDEVTALVRQGVREITLLGQNVNSYGRDLFGKPRFADLLRAVGDTGVERIFFTSSHPKDLLPETIDAMAETPAVMPQLHLAVQSGSTRILKEMNRRYTREDYLGLVDRIRNRMPDIALSTDIIVGFPGETEEDFEHDPTPHEVILERFNRLVKVIETTAHEYNQGELHTVVPALIEGTSKKNDAVLLGKSPKNQTVHAPIPEGYSIDLLVGKIVDVDVDVAKTWYLSGSVVGEPR